MKNRVRDRLKIVKDRLKRRSPLQRHTFNVLGIWCGFGAILGLTFHHFTYECGYRAKSLVFTFALLQAIWMIALIAVLGRYLARETDEYLRMVVVKALLWGAAITIAGDTIQSALVALSDFWNLDPGGLGSFNLDLFVVAAGISLVIQLWRNR